MKFATALLLAAFTCAAQTPPFRIVFEPESDQFADAAREYQTLWDRDGAKIVAAMEAVSGLKFDERVIQAIVREAASLSGYKDEKSMVLRASYPLDTKKATLVHELGHRLQVDLFSHEEE